MPVTKLAKWKTAAQMFALPVLLVGDVGLPGYPVNLAGNILLWIAGALTLVTGYDYLRAGLAQMQKADAAPKPDSKP